MAPEGFDPGFDVRRDLQLLLVPEHSLLLAGCEAVYLFGRVPERNAAVSQLARSPLVRSLTVYCCNAFSIYPSAQFFRETTIATTVNGVFLPKGHVSGILHIQALH